MPTSIPVEAELTLLRHQAMALQRRRSRRFRCHLATLGKVIFPGRDERVDACVYNLSKTGVGLNMAEPIETGTEIVVRIRVQGEPTPHEFAAAVVHSTQEVDRTWRVGCSFHVPLPAELLERILE